MYTVASWSAFSRAKREQRILKTDWWKKQYPKFNANPKLKRKDTLAINCYISIALNVCHLGFFGEYSEPLIISH